MGEAQMPTATFVYPKILVYKMGQDENGNLRFRCKAKRGHFPFYKVGVMVDFTLIWNHALKKVGRVRIQGKSWSWRFLSCGVHLVSPPFLLQPLLEAFLSKAQVDPELLPIVEEELAAELRCLCK